MLVATIKKTIESRALARPGDHLIVACSGGPDSVALVHGLARLQRDLRLALTVTSVDHGLRPEAAEEVRRVAALAESLGLPFVGLSVTVESGASRQAKARTARYAALQALREREGADAIAVGHTMDDQAETVLDRILRGGSLRGLAGIAPVRADRVIRPLLDCRRAEVMAHVHHHQLPFVSDPSNDDPHYRRVQIRNEVLPVLHRLDPAVVEHLAHLADDARAMATQTAGEAAALLSRAARSPARLDAGLVRAAPRAVRTEAIRVHLRGVLGSDPRRSHIEDADSLLHRGRGQVRIDGRRALALEEDSLVIVDVTNTPVRGQG